MGRFASYKNDDRKHQKFVTLNNAGNSPENPVVPGITFWIVYHRHAGEALRKLWIQRPAEPLPGHLYTDLTSRVVTTASDFSCRVVSGTDLKPATDYTAPQLNKIMWTTSHGLSISYIYVAPGPVDDDGEWKTGERSILLNGYDGYDPYNPLLDYGDASTIPSEESDYEYPWECP